MADIRVNTEQFRWAGEHLARAEKPIQNAVRRELRAQGKPVGERVLNALADAMPKRGGLADRIRANGQVSMLVTLRSGASIRLVNRAGMYMGAFEKGVVRHPVYGNRQVWRGTTVPGGKGREQFDKETPALAEAVAKSVTDAVWREVLK